MIEGLPLPPTAILIPAMRPHRFEAIVKNIEAVTPEPHSVVWMVGTDEAEAELVRLSQRHFRDEGGSWPVRINYLFAHTDEPYVFLGSDDVTWHERWLTNAMRVMVTGIDGVVAVADMWNPSGTLALVSRNYINTEGGTWDAEPGVVIHPGYAHNWSERETFDVAIARGRFAYCGESVVEHLYWGAGKSDYDDVYALGDSSIAQDQALYRSRTPA